MNMLNGVEVLNKVEMYKKFPIILIIPMMVFLVLSMVISFEDGLKNKLISILFAICSMISIVTGFVINSQPSGITQYQVTIDESVSMVEFNERYEVIEVEGKIYTIVEKEESDGQRANIN